VEASGETAVHVAAHAANTVALQQLLRAGATPNIQNCRGLAPIHYAAAVGSSACCKHLLQAQAALDVTDNLNRTPAVWARLCENQREAALLASMPADLEVSTDDMAPLLPIRQHERLSCLIRQRHQNAGNIKHPSPRTPRNRLTKLKPIDRAAENAAAADKDDLDDEVSDVASPAADATTTAASTSRRKSLLTKPGYTASLPKWPGNVSSLSLRWRSWALSAKGDGDDTTQHQQFAKQLGLSAIIPSAEADELCDSAVSQKAIARISEKLSGRFCTVCWEHMPDDHPHN